MKNISLPKAAPQGNESLNEKLDRLEAQLGKVGFKMGVEGLGILRLMDEIDAQIQDGLERGHQIKAEIGHYESLQAQLRKEAKALLREIGGSSALDAANPFRHQNPSAWWWRLDVYLDEKRRSEQRRFLVGLGITVLVVAILAVIYNVFLAPDEITIARFESRQNAEQLAKTGDLNQALLELEKGLAVAPSDAELLVLKGCILERLDRKPEALTVFSEAERSAGGRENFLVLRSQSQYILGDTNSSLADALEIIERVNPASAIGHLLAGSAYEALKQYPKAMAAFEKSYELADQQKNYQLAAQARIRLAYLSQTMMSAPFGGGQ